MSLLRFYYVSTLEFSLKDRTLPFDGSYPAAIERERNGKKYRLGHRGRILSRGERTRVKKNGRLTFATRVREGREGGGSKALSFSTRVPRGIRARSARTYFAIFSRHAISGMTNGGCAPCYPPSIIPSSFVRLSVLPFFLCSLCYNTLFLAPSPALAPSSIVNAAVSW